MRARLVGRFRGDFAPKWTIVSAGGGADGRPKVPRRGRGLTASCQPPEDRLPKEPASHEDQLAENRVPKNRALEKPARREQSRDAGPARYDSSWQAPNTEPWVRRHPPLPAALERCVPVERCRRLREGPPAPRETITADYQNASHQDISSK